MRAIKFRAWDKEKKCLIAVPNLYLGDDGSGRTIMILLRTAEGHGRTLVAGENCELMQFTGFVDKNDKEVYEGDILANKWGKWVVFWDRGGFLTRGEDDMRYDLGDLNGMGLEILGNIYENADLLKDSA